MNSLKGSQTHSQCGVLKNHHIDELPEASKSSNTEISSSVFSNSLNAVGGDSKCNSLSSNENSSQKDDHKALKSLEDDINSMKRACMSMLCQINKPDGNVSTDISQSFQRRISCPQTLQQCQNGWLTLHDDSLEDEKQAELSGKTATMQHLQTKRNSGAAITNDNLDIETTAFERSKLDDRHDDFIIERASMKSAFKQTLNIGKQDDSTKFVISERSRKTKTQANQKAKATGNEIESNWFFKRYSLGQEKINESNVEDLSRPAVSLNDIRTEEKDIQTPKINTVPKNSSEVVFSALKDIGEKIFQKLKPNITDKAMKLESSCRALSLRPDDLPSFKEDIEELLRIVAAKGKRRKSDKETKYEYADMLTSNSSFKTPSLKQAKLNEHSTYDSSRLERTAETNNIPTFTGRQFEVVSESATFITPSIEYEKIHTHNFNAIKPSHAELVSASNTRSLSLQTRKGRKSITRERLRSIHTVLGSARRSTVYGKDECLLLGKNPDDLSYAQSEPCDDHSCSLDNYDVKSDQVVVPGFCRPTIYRIYAKAAHHMTRKKKKLALLQGSSTKSDERAKENALIIEFGVGDALLKSDEDTSQVTSDRDIVGRLPDTVKIVDEKNCVSEEFADFLYLVIKRKLCEEFDKISKFAPSSHVNSVFNKDPNWHPYLTSLEYMVEGMMKEMEAIHSKKFYKSDSYRKKDNLMSGVLTNLNDIICEDRGFTRDDIEGLSVENMRRETMIWKYTNDDLISKSPDSEIAIPSKLASQVLQKCPFSDRGSFDWRKYFRRKYTSQDRQKFEANLRKTIELGFVSEDCSSSEVEAGSPSPTVKQITLILKSDAIRRGGDAGARLWNMTTKRILYECDDVYEPPDVSDT